MLPTDPIRSEHQALLPHIAALRDAADAIGGGTREDLATIDEALARKHIEMGASFIAVGTDSNLMVKATSALAAKFKGSAPQAAAKGNY